MKNFEIEAEGTTFKFNSMNRRRTQLFQVYVMHDNQEARFHMQLNEDTGDFFITDKGQCPEIYLKAEEILGNAIKIYGKLDKIPS